MAANDDHIREMKRAMIKEVIVDGFLGFFLSVVSLVLKDTTDSHTHHQMMISFTIRLLLEELREISRAVANMDRSVFLAGQLARVGVNAVMFFIGWMLYIQFMVKNGVKGDVVVIPYERSIFHYAATLLSALPTFAIIQGGFNILLIWISLISRLIRDFMD